MAESLMDRRTVYGQRAKLGVIVPPTNTTNEAEWQLMAPTDVSIHSARMPLHTDTTSAAGQAALYNDIATYATDLSRADVDVIIYGCTAGSMVTPVTSLADFITSRTGIPGLTTAQAIVAALQSLSVNRLSVATPYHDAMNQHEKSFLQEHGFEVVSMEGLGYGEHGPEEYRNIARVCPETVTELVTGIDDQRSDAVLVSCTDLVSLPVIAQLEATLNKPVISSNSATLWRALRIAGVDDTIPDGGSLFEC